MVKPYYTCRYEYCVLLPSGTDGDEVREAIKMLAESESASEQDDEEADDTQDKELVLFEGELVNRRSDEGLCLGVEGKEILIADCADDDQDDWQYLETGELRNKMTGLCVSATDGVIGTPVLLDECNGEISQKWFLKPTSGDSLSLFPFQIVHQKYNLCLDLPEKLGDKGLKAQLLDCSATEDNQKYRWQQRNGTANSTNNSSQE